jgi:hypothetical protein
MQQFWLFVHVLSVVVAFGSFFSTQSLMRSGSSNGETLAKVATYVQAPALGVILISGILGTYAIERALFQQTWIHIAFTLWMAMAAVMFFLIKALKQGSKAVAGLTGAMHLLLVLALWAMIWKPNFA